MNIFTKSALTFLFTASVATVAVAQPGDATFGNIVSGKSHVHSLESQLNRNGMAVNTSVDTNAAISPSEKAAVLNQEASDLELQLEVLKAQRSE